EYSNYKHYQVGATTPSDDHRQAHQAADWFEHGPKRDQFPRLIANNIGVHYFLDISPTERLRTREWRKTVIAQAQPGTIINWDPVFGVYNSDATRSVRATDIDSAGWVLDIPASLAVNDLSDSAELDDSRWLIWRSPKSLAGESTPIVTS